MKSILFSFVSILPYLAFGQKSTPLRLSDKQQQLVSSLRLLRSAKTDSLKEVLNIAFKSQLQTYLETESFGPKDFDSLLTLGKIWSDDLLVGVLSWNVQQEDFSHRYFAYVLKKNPSNKKVQITELIDNSVGQGNTKPNEILDPENWYGALYYDIIDVKKGNKIYYTLLGWDGAYTNSNMKLIDVMTFAGNTPKFGAPIFRLGDKTLKRVFFEHSERAHMSLKFDTNRELLIYDHLSPESPNLVGFYDYYVPDLSYDGLKWEKDKWILKEDILALNSGSNDVILARTNKDGTVETKTIDSKWENPSEGGRGDYAHKAAKPEDEVEPSDKKKKKKKTTNASDKDPNATYSDKDFQKGAKKSKNPKR